MQSLYARLGFVMDWRSIGHWLIHRVTGGPGHVFIEFFNPQEPERFFYDSVIAKDPTTGKNGVRGPIDIDYWYQWRDTDPKHRDLYFVPENGYLPLEDSQVWDALVRLNHALHEIEYAKLQLPQNWLAGRTGIQISWRFGSPNRWTCSETPMRVLIPVEWWDLFGPQHPKLKCRGGMLDLRADFVVPGGNSFMSLEEGARRAIEEHGVLEVTQ